MGLFFRDVKVTEAFIVACVPHPPKLARASTLMRFAVMLLFNARAWTLAQVENAYFSSG